LRSLGNVDDKLKNQLINDYRTADITDKDKIILEFVEKVTYHPATVNQVDIDHLKNAGLDDHAIHDIVQVTGYFNYVNRLADGLGVELEK